MRSLSNPVSSIETCHGASQFIPQIPTPESEWGGIVLQSIGRLLVHAETQSTEIDSSSMVRFFLNCTGVTDVA
jgi:hypothetical protein